MDLTVALGVGSWMISLGDDNDPSTCSSPEGGAFSSGKPPLAESFCGTNSPEPLSGNAGVATSHVIHAGCP